MKTNCISNQLFSIFKWWFWFSFFNFALLGPEFSKILKYLEKSSYFLQAVGMSKTYIKSITSYFSSSVRKCKVYTLIFFKYLIYLVPHIYFSEMTQHLTSFSLYQNCSICSTYYIFLKLLLIYFYYVFLKADILEIYEK